MPTAWSALTLCTPDDVTQEVRDLAIPLLGATPSETAAVVASKIALAKEHIRAELLVRLPGMFVNANGRSMTYGAFTSWYAETAGYSYTQLDTILDKIDNPTELKLPAVAATVYLSLSDGMLRDNATFNRNLDMLAVLTTQWERAFRQRLDTAVQLLRFDLNSDGAITDNERARTHNHLWRS